MTKHISPWRGAHKFDSKFEKKLQEGVLAGADYHPKAMKYEVRKDCKYTPDFVFVETSGKKIYVEAKGRFRTSDEANKYIHIRNSLKLHTEELVFLFMSGKTPMPNAKRRKDGTKNSVAEWAEKNSFVWYTESTFSEAYKHLGEGHGL